MLFSQPELGYGDAAPFRSARVSCLKGNCMVVVGKHVTVLQNVV